MSSFSNSSSSSRTKVSSFGIGSFLFGIIFGLLVYLLILSMVRHHFFTGGHPNHSAACFTLGN
jgi:hypothetical protein